MNYEELKKIGEWLNTKGYGIDLTDDFWMEEYDWGEHKTREICQMLFDYHTEQCNIANVVGQSEQLCKKNDIVQSVEIIDGGKWIKGKH